MNCKAKFIAGAVAVLSATLTGCATASSSAGAPVGMTPTTASQSPSASPTTAPVSAPAIRTFTFHGMTIRLAAGWKPGTVVRMADGTTFSGVVTGGPCRSSSFGRDCPGFILEYQPDYQPGQVFEYISNGQNGCPQNRGLMQNWPSDSQAIVSPVTVGGRKADLTQDTAQCLSNNPNGGATKTYVQYAWWIPSDQILVVDDGWLVPGLGSVLAYATWATSSASSLTSYVGTWTRHTDTFVIKANGSGTETDSDGTCPTNPAWMCGFTADLTFTMTPYGLKATYTSVTPTVNGVPSGEYVLDPSEPKPHDSFVLVFDTHDRLVVTDLSRPTRFNTGPGRTRLCGAHTPAAYSC